MTNGRQAEDNGVGAHPQESRAGVATRPRPVQTSLNADRGSHLAMARGLAPDGRTKPGARVGWGAVAAGARALKEKAERSGASPCEFDYQVGRRGCLLLAIGPVREAQNPAASSRVLRASAVRSSTLYAIEDLRFTIYHPNCDQIR